MRLICPNCGAQYEVDARVIPDTGRDVQCSNCGHTWFQRPALQDAELADELGYEITEPQASEDDVAHTPDFDDADATLASDIEEASYEDDDGGDDGQWGDETTPYDQDDIHHEPEPAPDAEHEPKPEPEFEPEAEAHPEPSPSFDDSDEADDDFDAETSGSEAPPIPAAGLSDSVRNILRAEAEYDQAMRKVSPGSLESQPDLGLDEAPDPAKKSLRDRMARLRGIEADDPQTAEATGRRRDLLPDIEEINSTLSASSERDEDGSVPDEETLRERSSKRGFRVVFTLLVSTAAVLVALYGFAPQLAERFPQAAATLDLYVAGANSFRDWLDVTLSSASSRLNTLLGQLSGGE